MFLFSLMSSSQSPRSLSLVPFLAADAVLLFTAGMIAWRTSDELSGGALLAVVVCVGLGAVITVLPFILRDAREREAALAERQRELAELVTTSTASASRWGTQWAAAATGLEDAATLASRSLAAAERLPAAFQEKTDALTQRLEQLEREAQARAGADAQQAAVLAERADQIGAASAGLQQTLVGFSGVAEELKAQQAAITAALAEFPAVVAQARTARMEFEAQQASVQAERADQIGVASEGLQQTLAGFGGVAQELKAQQAAITAALAEFPVAAAQARTARAEFEGQLAGIPAQLEARVERLATEAETRLTATVAALTVRLSEVEGAVTALLAQCQRAVAEARVVPVVEKPETLVEEPASVVIETPAVVVVPEPVVVESVPLAVEETPVVEVVPVAVTARPEAVAAPEVVKPVARSETIMDPFLIPADGYAALAEAMDARNA